MRDSRMVAAAATAMIALLAAGCTTGQDGSATHAAHGQSASAGKDGATTTGSHATRLKPAPAGPKITTLPASGSTDGDPSGGVTVTATRGTLTSVTVTPSGGVAAAGGNPSGPVPGSLNAARTAWHSTWALGVSQKYSVTATATYHGITKALTSTFTTLSPRWTFSTNIFEAYGQSYGVGMPIILLFSQPIKDKAAVERSLEITTSRPVVGAWYWDTDESLVFRPRDYWPAHTTVSFTGHFNGVEGAPGMYGHHTLTQTFTIGQSVIAVASTKTHRTQVYVGGKLAYNWPISTGRPGDDTPNGSYLTIEKKNPVRMKGRGYNLLVPWSVRFTWSGDYYHDAYWSTSVQGADNVSHGCVNLSPARAKTYYDLTVPGNPITVKDSPRAGTWDNGWTEWFLNWRQLLAGSATHLAVQAGPAGSAFVSPSAVPADAARAPLQVAASGAWGSGAP